MAPYLGYRKKSFQEQVQQAQDKYNAVREIGSFIGKKTDTVKGGSFKQGWNKYIGTAAGAGLGYIVGDVPGSIAGGILGYQAGKKVD